MKKILVPCDFTITAVNAFRYALDVAKQSNGTVHLIYVLEMPVLHDSVLMPTLYFEKAFLNDVQTATQERFEKMIAKFNTGKVNVTAKVEFGVPSKAIQDYVKKHAIDVVIMGSHGASGVKEFVIGSNAAKIVRTSVVPVLVVKDRPRGPVKRIVFPHALPDVEQADLIMKVKALQSFFKAHLFLVWINTPLNFTPDTITRPKLKALAKQFELKNCTMDIFNYSSSGDGIIAYAESVKANLIAMGTHGRTGVAHVLNKSIAEHVVNHVSTPVWTIVTKEGK